MGEVYTLLTYSKTRVRTSPYITLSRGDKMSYYSEQALQEKLNRLSTSQDSIETLSTWIVHHRPHATTSISIWLQNYVDGNLQLVLYTCNKNRNHACVVT